MTITSEQAVEDSAKAQLIASLDRHIDLYRASKIRKLCRIGGKIAYSKLVAKFAREPRQTQIRLFWGGKLTVVLPELVSTALYRYGFFEPDVSHMLLEILKPGMTFYDIGAHVGYFSRLASEIVGPKGQVHSFEPTPSTFEFLLANTRDHANITVNNVAVFSSSSQLTFQDFGIRHCAYNSAAGAKLTEAKDQVTARTYEVQAITIDQYVQRTGSKPDMIKIDAENAEYQILSGMRQTLQEVRPVITLEVDDTGKDPASGGSAQVVKLLEDHGYAPFEWRDNRLEPHMKRKEYEYGNLLFRSMA